MNAAELLLNLPNRVVPIQFHDEGIEWVGRKITDIFDQRKPKVFILCDERVALHYLAEFSRILTNAGFSAQHFTFAPGEPQKTLPRISEILDALTMEAFARDDLLIGVGGGVTTDMAGFAASIYRRGMNWLAVPTSLMGMVDAAIGGKTGVNHPLGKNLIGAFYQPHSILVPLKTLETLDAREWLSGSAEVVKSALLSGGELWSAVFEHGPDLHTWPRKSVHDAIRQSAVVKIRIVAEDEREAGVRRLLNLGHTFAHALETVTDYRVYTHGEAVFIGLRAAAFLSERLNYLSRAVAAEIAAVLDRVHLPFAEIKPEDLAASLTQDKKTVEDRLHWILLRDIGKPVVETNVPSAVIHEAVEFVAAIAAQGRANKVGPKRLRILVINGANLNLLGEREPEYYGRESYEDLKNAVREYAQKCDIEILIRRSNIEGELIELIQFARHWADGIILNPGGYTHTSVAIRDAITAAELPTIEVHISDISNREEFRRRSLIAPVCAQTIAGQGIAGYLKAMDWLTTHRAMINQHI